MRLHFVLGLAHTNLAIMEIAYFLHVLPARIPVDGAFNHSVERFQEDEVSVSRFTGIVWTESQFVQQNVRFQKKCIKKLGLNKRQLQPKA